MKHTQMILLAGLLLSGSVLGAFPSVTEKQNEFQIETDGMSVTLWKWLGLKLHQKGALKNENFFPVVHPFPKTRIQTESVKILRNDGDVLILQWKSKPFEHRFGAVVREEADYCFKKDFPGMFIRMRLFNTSPERTNLNQSFSFSAKNCPEMPTEKGLVKVDGQAAEAKAINAGNYFLYTDPTGRTWGIISADLENKNRRLFANTPIRNKGNWLLGYIRPGSEKTFANGEFSSLHVILFPAQTLEEVRGIYEKLIRDRSLDPFWKYLQ